MQITPAQLRFLLAELGLSSGSQLTVGHITRYYQDHKKHVLPDQVVILGAIEEYLADVLNPPSGRLSSEAFAARLHDPVVFLKVLLPDPEIEETESDVQPSQVAWGMEQGLSVAVDRVGVLEGFKIAGAITFGFASLILLGGALLVASPLIVSAMAYEDRVKKKKFYAELPDVLRPFLDQFFQLPKKWNFQIRSVASLVDLVADPVFFEHIKKLMDAYLGIYEWVIDEYAGTDRPLIVEDVDERFATFGILSDDMEYRQKIYQALKYRISEALMGFVTILVMPCIEDRQYRERMEATWGYAREHGIAEVTRHRSELQRMLDEFMGDLKEDHAQLKSLWDRINNPQALIYWLMARYLDDPFQKRPWSEYGVTPSTPLQAKDYERIKHLAILWDNVFIRIHLREISDFYLLPADKDKYKALCLLFPQVGETMDNYGTKLDRLERDLQGMARWMPRWTKARHREAEIAFGLLTAMRDSWWAFFDQDSLKLGPKSRLWRMPVVTMTSSSIASEGEEALKKDPNYPAISTSQPVVITSLHQPVVPTKFVLTIHPHQPRMPDNRDIIAGARRGNYAAYMCTLPPYSWDRAKTRHRVGYTGYLQNPHERSLMEASFRVHVALDYGLDPRQINNIEIVTMPPSITPGSPLKPRGRRSDRDSGPRARSGPAVESGLRVVRDSDKGGGGIEDSVPVIGSTDVVQGGGSILGLSGASLVRAAPERDDVRNPPTRGSDVTDVPMDDAMAGLAETDSHLVHGTAVYSGLTPVARPTALQRGLLKAL